jgi:beta-lactamase regulating signal transducer with metallopeptidase domain
MIAAMEEAVFNLLLNWLLQIGIFAIVAGAFSRLVARAKAKHQHFFYIAVLLLCLVGPVVNTVWRPSAPVAAVGRSQPSMRAGAAAGRLVWPWQTVRTQHRTLTITPALQGWISGVWTLFVLLQLARYIHAVHQIHRLQKAAFDLSPEQAAMARKAISGKSTVHILQSTAIDDPVTISVFRSVILLPTRVLPSLGPEEMSAVIAHEYSHIRRRDFSVHMLCKFLSLPVTWHPGIAYLMSKISQTRELACDEDAATYLGNRRSYARTLLRLASLCMHTARLSAAEVGFLGGNDLEQRIAMLTGKALVLTRTGFIGIALATSMTFGACAMVAHALSLQASAEPAKTSDQFVGTWHWMFEGKSFVTMVILRGNGRLTGTVTGSRIALNEDGQLDRADPSENVTPNPITKATREGSAALRITVMDGNKPFEFVMKLKDATHADIHPTKAPAKMKAIQAEKAL